MSCVLSSVKTVDLSIREWDFPHMLQECFYSIVFVYKCYIFILTDLLISMCYNYGNFALNYTILLPLSVTYLAHDLDHNCHVHDHGLLICTILDSVFKIIIYFTYLKFRS